MRKLILASGIAILLFAVVSCDQGSTNQKEISNIDKIIGSESPIVYTTDGLTDGPNNEDYQVVLEDGDGWLLQLNVCYSSSIRIRYTGRLYYSYGSSEYGGSAQAIYDVSRDVLLFIANDDWGDGDVIGYTVSLGEDNYYNSDWVYLERYIIGSRINVELIQGTVGPHSATDRMAKMSNWTLKEASLKTAAEQ